MRRGYERDHDERGGTSHDPFADVLQDEEPSLLVRIARIVVPWVILIAAVTAALSFWSEFRLQTDRARSGDTTSTIESTATPDGASGPSDGSGGSSAPTGTVSTDEPYVRVKADGLNFRTSASTDAEVISKLPGGTVLTYVDSANGWYQVRDSAGVEGWVAAGGSFTELVTP